MVDFFGNSSETHVKLDMKAIAITKNKFSFQDYSLKPLDHPSKANLIYIFILYYIYMVSEILDRVHDYELCSAKVTHEKLIYPKLTFC